MSFVTYGVTVSVTCVGHATTLQAPTSDPDLPTGASYKPSLGVRDKTNLFLRQQAKKNLSQSRDRQTLPTKAFFIAIITNNKKAGHLEKLQKATVTLR